MDEREEALEKAQQTMRRLQHEVRTPLGQIMGYSELLEEELEDRGQQDLAPDLQRIRDAAQRLLDLVDGKLRTDQDPGAPTLPPTQPAQPALTAPEPAAETEDADAGEEPPAPEDSGPRGRLLVIDDDPNNRDILVRRLQRHGFEVETARDGVDGLRRIEAGAYDLVILDVMMPGMSGFEVLERVRRQHSMSELPVILATALDSSSDAVEGLERGANDYVTKPFDLPVVAARIETHLAAHRSAKEVAELAKQLEFRNAFIRQALGREVSEGLLVETAETPDAVDLSGERRRVTVVVADLKDAGRLASELSPAEFMTVLNHVLTGLSDVVAAHGGIVEATPGDSLVALFGIPVAAEDDAARAVACAVALQLEMEEINARNARAQLPEVAIGVGVASGEVIAGGIGTGDRLRYKVVGPTLPKAARIEAGAGGQEIWICPETRAAAADVLHLDQQREVALEEDDAPVELRRVLGVGGRHLISLREVPPSG